MTDRITLVHKACEVILLSITVICLQRHQRRQTCKFVVGHLATAMVLLYGGKYCGEALCSVESVASSIEERFQTPKPMTARVTLIASKSVKLKLSQV